MNARERILQAVASGKPALQPLPSTIGFTSTYSDLSQQFATILQAIGGTVVNVNSTADIETYLQQHYDLSLPTLSLVKGTTIHSVAANSADNPHLFESLNLVVFKAQLGVAENGAVWLDEQNFPLRVLPFISQHMAVVLSAEDIVGNMHEAYQKISFQTGYGAFIAGPSKTADIEQSLVIGAHGSRSMVVFLLSEM